MTTVVSVRFRSGCKTYFFDPRELTVETGQDVIVETAQGPEFAQCSQGNHEVPDQQVVQPLRAVLRIATDNDRHTAAYNRGREKEAFEICQKKIAQHKLEMKLVRVECSFDGSKILFFFTADGRVDFRELVTVEFWGWVIPQVKAQYPNLIFIAEVYNPAEYRNYLFNGKFDYLYDKVGLYDTLRAITSGWESATSIPSRWQSLSGIEHRMLNFLENHDEQRIASDFFAGNGARAIPAMIVSACMNDNPVMIYFGQEIGEQGMDTEGFSGRDGRTTIFDYWSVDSIRRWRNNGKFDDKLLTEEEKKLRTFYSRLLNLCNTEKAIREGVFFDLTYANLAGWVFNEHKQYAFMRKLDDELLLIMVNFDSIPVRAAVNIPQHAFDFLGIPYNLEYNAVELLTGNTEKLVLSPDKTTPVLLDAMNGKILKFKL